jgi:hypothetical protein
LASSTSPPIRQKHAADQNACSERSKTVPKDLKLEGIKDVETANRFLRETYLARHNARFAVEAAEAGSGFVPVAQMQWREVLCLHEDRIVAPDNTITWNRRRLQIPAHPARAHFVRAKVTVHAYPEGELAIFHGPRCLVRWTPEHTVNQDRSAA